MTFMLLQELLQPPWVLRIPSSWYVQKELVTDKYPLKQTCHNKKVYHSFSLVEYFHVVYFASFFGWCDWNTWILDKSQSSNNAHPSFSQIISCTFYRSFYCRGCDKPCGGGQQTREKVCLGSDGLKYPSLLGGWLLDGWMVGWWMVGGEFFLIFFFIARILGGSKIASECASAAF